MNRAGRTTRVLAGLVGVAAALCTAVAPAQADSAGSATHVQISQDRTSARALIGAPFAFSTTVRNPDDAPLTGLVAHLNVVSLDPAVYVDPEDWSTRRTQYLSPVPGHGTVRLSWSVHAVNDGRFVLYVALATAGGESVTAGPALHAVVRAQQRIDAAGILPVAIAVPSVVLVLLIAARYRRRRLV